MIKKVISAIIALSMLFMTACGDSSKSDDKSSSSKQESSSAAETTTTTTAESKTETTTTETSTSAPQAPAEVFDLAKAYSSSPRAINCRSASYMLNGDPSEKAAVSDDGKHAYFLAHYSNKDYRYSIYQYDMNTKKSKPFITKKDDSITGFAYYNGSIYITGTMSEGFYIAKYDENGKLIAKVNEENTDYCVALGRYETEPENHYVAYVLDNGKVIINGINKKGEEDSPSVCVIFSSDLKDNKVVWHETDIGHGDVKEKKSPDGFTNNGCYYMYTDKNDSKKLSVYDSDSEKWTEFSWENEEEPLYDGVFVYGDYVIAYYSNPDYLKPRYSTCLAVFSISTLQEHSFTVSNSYKGGESTYVLGSFSENPNEYGWYRVNAVINNDGNCDFKFVSPQKETGEDENSMIYYINDKYYTYVDEYGIFLRTYEKGEKEEEKLWVFDEHK